ncbi:MAG: transcription elongation factor [Ketobacter sp.]|nr:transcription elongation factor [Ketobacter sp.]
MPIEYNKEALLTAIIKALEALVDNARNAMQVAYETATHEENIAENKYDTLGLEAAYLTQGQAQRLAECEADLAAFKSIKPYSFKKADAIGVGALVELIDDDNHTHLFFLGPAAGGLKVECNGNIIMVVTTKAPLGKALHNSHLGDDLTVALGNKQKHYEVVAIN